MIVNSFKNLNRYVKWLVLAFLLVPIIAQAKRGIAPTVAPVTYEDVRYIAPNDDGGRGYVQAWSVKTGTMLWQATLFRIVYDPLIEQDVQDVYITEMSIWGGRLIIATEDGQYYSLDLKTRAIHHFRIKAW